MAGPVDPRLLRRGRATRRFLLALAGVGVVSSALVVVQARVIGTTVARVFQTHRTSGVAGAALLLGAVFAARGLLAWLGELLAHRASAEVKAGLRHDLLDARLVRSETSDVPTGTLLRLLTQGLDDLDGYYAKYLPQLVLAGLVPVVVLVAIGASDLTSALIIGITLPLIPLFMALIGYATRDQVNRRLRVASRLANHFADLVTGLATLQVFGRARNQVVGLRDSEGRHRRETMRTLRITFMSSLVLEFSATLAVALVAVTVGFRVLYGHMDLRTALFVLVLAPEAYLPVRQVGVHYHDAADGVAAADAAFALIEDAEHHRPSGGRPVPDTIALRFEDAAFRYPGASSDALSALDLSVAPGEVVALAGPSGGGKSTALALAAGFLQPTTGRVCVLDATPSGDRGTPGIDVHDLDADAWREGIAWVGQVPGMLRASVADNVALGSPDATASAVLAALQDAGAGDLDPATPVGDDAEGLSGGERRRVGVARALLRVRSGRARLLLLDEPTAGLDSDTEAVVLRAVRDAGVSALVVSHRPAVLAMVDRVVEVHPGPPTPAGVPHRPGATDTDTEVDDD